MHNMQMLVAQLTRIEEAEEKLRSRRRRFEEQVRAFGAKRGLRGYTTVHLRREMHYVTNKEG